MTAITSPEHTLAPDQPLAAAIASLPGGAVLLLPPGRYRANLVISKKLTLRAASGEVILDGGHRGSVLRISGNDTFISLEKITIAGGAGSALLIEGGAVHLTDVTFRGNHAQAEQPGSAIAIVDGKLRLDRCLVEKNIGHAALFIGGGAVAEITDTTFSHNSGGHGAVWVDEAARLTLVRATFIDNRSRIALHVTGTRFAAPIVSAAECRITATIAVENGPRDPGSVTLSHCEVQGGVIGVTDGGGNRFAT